MIVSLGGTLSGLCGEACCPAGRLQRLAVRLQIPAEEGAWPCAAETGTEPACQAVTQTEPGTETETETCCSAGRYQKPLSQSLLTLKELRRLRGPQPRTHPRLVRGTPGRTPGGCREGEWSAARALVGRCPFGAWDGPQQQAALPFGPLAAGASRWAASEASAGWEGRGRSLPAGAGGAGGQRKRSRAGQAEAQTWGCCGDLGLRLLGDSGLRMLADLS
mmetsp:Transcript_144898/g.252692  ORF Transcript_144898/g.252692 Transcript_144898/m.252692 type:complete len:219 (-) Transcript_144898:510-1166(-)